jgi:site-specific DNA-cytosine methylase
MACGYEALKRAGVPVTEYHAFEIDKHAIQVAKKNHGRPRGWILRPAFQICETF